MGREAYGKVVSANKFNYVPKEVAEPGPGAYSPEKSRTKDRYSMRPKTAVDSKLLLLNALTFLQYTPWSHRQALPRMIKPISSMKMIPTYPQNSKE